MKKIVLLSVLILSIRTMPLFAQMGQLSGFSVLPAAPLAGDSVWALIPYSINSMACPLVNSSVSLMGPNNWDVTLYHCSGMLPAICSGIDTLYLGQLSAGTYSVNTYLFVGSGFGGPCSAFNPADTSLNNTFTVGNPVGLKTYYTLPCNSVNMVNGQLTKANGEICNFNLIQLFDLYGRNLGSFTQLSELESFNSSQPAGMYVVRFYKNGGILGEVKLVNAVNH